MRLGLWWALGLLRVSLTTLGPLRLDNRRRRVDLFTRRNNFLRRIGKLFYANVEGCRLSGYYETLYQILNVILKLGLNFETNFHANLKQGLKITWLL